MDGQHELSWTTMEGHTGQYDPLINLYLTDGYEGRPHVDGQQIHVVVDEQFA